jgi:hypothetical protein
LILPAGVAAFLPGKNTLLKRRHLSGGTFFLNLDPESRKVLSGKNHLYAAKTQNHQFNPSHYLP